MIKAALILCILAIVSVTFAERAGVGNPGLRAVLISGNSTICTFARLGIVGGIGFTDPSCGVLPSPVKVTVSGVPVLAASSKEGERPTLVDNPSMGQREDINYVAVSFSKPWSGSDRVMGVVPPTLNGASSDIAYNVSLTPEKDSIPEPVSVALFGMGLLPLAFLVRRSPAQQVVTDREQARARHPRLSTERGGV